MSFATVIVGHGSRDAEAEAAFLQWMDLYRSLHPGRIFAHAFLELSPPFIGEVLRQLAEEHEDIVIVPLSLLPAAHVKNDIPLTLHEFRRQFPRPRFTVTQALGLHAALIQAVQRQVERCPQVDVASWTLLVVGRGASDPDANGQLYQIARVLAESAGMKQLEIAYIGITWPRLGETLQRLARLRPQGILMVPYLLFPGVLANRVAQMFDAFLQQHPWIQGQSVGPLGVTTALCEAVEDRIAEARGTPRLALPCVSCQYRVPLGALQDQVGGLRSLLWSVRHQATHQQGKPHQHAHAAMKKHVLVCTNYDCNSKGATVIAEELQRSLRKQRLHRDYRVTRTSCLGRCGEGPTVAVYPDGIWYRNFQKEDVPALVAQHLQRDQLLSERIDSIL
ncbi:CbiX/SirB N-terminal domain-containing protein [Oligoflexus tunisiensis]|uniref:CbiX/SirB N-terminal domain-containing protein n=1 Tax=Oligoflexus tunisiensis TaxID=708132 RepID=UPI000A7FAF6D|nr:CbiX/SirB N-terminal domain-containing protein [Oligoflexus tunisiensis]